MALILGRTLDGDRDCVILEIGAATQGDEVSYPTDDIEAVMDKNGIGHLPTKTGLIFISAL